MRALRSLSLVGWLLAVPALASVGEAKVVTGAATRTDAAGKTGPLKAGTRIELGDTLRATGGHVKLVLNDQSILMLGQGSELTIDEAQFRGQERAAFSAKLAIGSVWAKVKKLAVGSPAKFEVVTERAVAGVRGTTFRVDVRNTKLGPATQVLVVEGEVAVRWQVVAPELPAVAIREEGVRSPDSVPEKRAKRAMADEDAPAAAELAMAPAEVASAAPAPPPSPPRVAAAAPARRAAATRGGGGLSGGGAAAGAAAPAAKAEPPPKPQRPMKDQELSFTAKSGVRILPDGDWSPLMNEPMPADAFTQFVDAND